MTRQKHFKQRVRERMRATGETYAQARAALEAERAEAGAPRPRAEDPLRGVVRDAAGGPVAGAGLQLARRYLWKDDPAEELMGWGWSSRSAVVSDAAGAFALPRPEPGDLLEVGVVVVAPGHAALVRRVPAGRLARPLDLRLPPGPGQVVRGRVVDAATGAGLAGLAVHVSLDGLTLAGLVDGTGPADLAAEVPFGGGVEVVTDGDGRFEAGGLPRFGGGRVEVERQAPWAGAQVDLPPGRPCAVELRLEPTAVLVVRVVDEAGRPVVGARVDAWESVGGGRMWHEGPRTGAHGTCRLARDAGDHSVGVVAPAPGPWSVDAPDLLEHAVLVAGAERTLELRLAARPGGAVECRVRRQGSGEVAAGVEVWLSSASSRGWLTARRASVGDDGRALFAGLQPGRYHLQASGSASAPPLATVDVEADPVMVDLEVPAPRALRVRVLDPAGRPVAGASVRSHAEDGAQTAARTDAAGQTTLIVRREQVSVYVEAAGFARGWARPEADGPDEVVVSLVAARPLTVTGRVDAALEGARVWYWILAAGRWGQCGDSGPVGPGGVLRLVLDDVGPGAGRVALRVGAALPVAADFAPTDEALDLGRVEPSSGTTLRARVADGSWTRGDEPWVTVRTPDLGSVRGELSRDGQLVVRGLPPTADRLDVSVSSTTLDGPSWSVRVPLDAATLARGELPRLVLEEVAELPPDD